LDSEYILNKLDVYDEFVIYELLKYLKQIIL